MRVSILDLDTVLNAPDKDQDPAVLDFFETFGVKNCSLCCVEWKQAVDEAQTKLLGPRSHRSRQRPQLRKLHRSDYVPEWGGPFTIQDLSTSTKNGCGSCGVFKLLLESLFVAISDLKNSDTICQWRGPGFELQILDEHAKIAHVIKFFHPNGSHVYFRGMTKSNFLSGNTASDATYNRLRQWIQNCVSCHSSCGNGHENQIPRRLLDVTPIESGGDPGVRLVEAVSSFGTYTCLSHCWGVAPMTARTVLQNLESYKDFLPWSTLPQNFKDAVIITRRLGIQFVWIDSLCIVQDDKKDWEVESAKMADIYRNASLTIASAWSPDSRGGCFTTTRSDLCFELNGAHGISTLIGARLCDPCDGIGSTTNMKTVKYRFPLFQRAWVYQERLLSTRILYCNYGEFNFECNETSACECSNNILGPHIAGRINNGEYLRRKAVHVTKLRLNHNADLKVITDWWRQMVEEYSSLSLTEPADMLPAISGCAKEIAKITGDVYLSGLWKRTLIDDLLWFQRGKWQPRPAWRAPSWSWASVDTLNGIRYIRNQYAQCTRVIDGKIQQASCELAGENPTGAVKSGCIRLVAGLFPAFMRKFCRSQDLRTDHRGIHDLHAPSTSAAYNTSCQVHEKMLDPRQGRMEFWRDARIDEQELQFSASPAPDSCKECGLAPVYLLHLALMNGLVRGKRTCNDYFMVLRQVSSDSQTYSRIGLLNIVQDSLSARDDWLMEVWNKSVMSEKTVTLI